MSVVAEGTGNGRRRRQHENIPGENWLSRWAPPGWSAVAFVGAAVVGTVTAYNTIGANAGAIEKIIEHNAAQATVIQELNTKQELAAQEFRIYTKNEERREREQAERDLETRRLLQRILQGINGGSE